MLSRGQRMLDILLLTILTEKDEVERTSALVFLEEHGKSLVWDEESGTDLKSVFLFQIISPGYWRSHMKNTWKTPFFKHIAIRSACGRFTSCWKTSWDLQWTGRGWPTPWSRRRTAMRRYTHLLCVSGFVGHVGVIFEISEHLDENVNYNIV